MRRRAALTVFALALLAIPASTVRETYVGSAAYLCRMEPSVTPGGYEVIAYPFPDESVLTTPDNGGFEVPCPQT